MMKRMAAALVCALLLGVLAAPVHADGFIVPIPPHEHPLPPDAITIAYHHVQVAWTDQAAVTTVDQAFANNTPRLLEGDYFFPIPPGAAVTDFAILRDGQRLGAQVLTREEAAQRYQQIVSALRDPGLLEFAGRGAYHARIYPIPPNGSTQVQVAYAEVLPLDGGLMRYHYPLTPERLSRDPIADLRVTISVSQHAGIGTIYCPTHDVQIVRQGPNNATITYIDEHVRPDKDLVLYIGTANSDLAINVLSYREPGDDGFFLMAVSPTPTDQAAVAQPTDYVILMDTSGSMRGDKIEQAKLAVTAIAASLRPNDRLYLATFATQCTPLQSEPLDPAELDTLLAQVRAVVAAGGTNIEAALKAALALDTDGRAQAVILVTDGLPTVGEIRTPALLEMVRDQSALERRFFAFGVGYDVDTVLLDTLTHEHRGATAYVQPDERLDAVLTGFHDKLSHAVLSNLAIDWGTAQVYDVAPFELPELFAGEQLILVGRYRQSGDTTITLSGTQSGQQVKKAFSQIRLRQTGGSAFVPRLWATRRIGELLTAIRLYGPDRELVDEIVALSVRYGIVTPYTSYLVTDDEPLPLGETGVKETAQREYAAMEAKAAAGGGEVRGEAAVGQSVDQANLAQADQAQSSATDRVRWAGTRTFVLDGARWVDTTWDAATMPAEPVVWGSPAYFALLQDLPDLAPAFSLGRDVLIVANGQAYDIRDTGKTWATSGAVQPTPASAAKDASGPLRKPPAIRFLSQWLTKLAELLRD
jgi:Ca-activated chloride channel family protein